MHTIRAIRLLAVAALACVLPPVLAQTNAPLTGGVSAPIVRPVPPSAPAAPAVPAAPVAAAATARPDGQAVVRQVPSPVQAPAAAPSAGAEQAPREAQFGDITRGLIGLQAGGQRAGPGQPLQGAVATAAWKRYMKSFEHPIPQWFGGGVQPQGNVDGLGQ